MQVDQSRACSSGNQHAPSHPHHENLHDENQSMDAPISTETIERVAQYVDRISKYRLAVCKECQHAVWPQQMRRHFNGPKHTISYPLVDDIVRVVNTWTQLIQRPEQLTIPDSVEQPISHLELIRDGFLCDIKPDQCHYIAHTQESIRVHIQQKHRSSRYRRTGRPSQSQRARVEMGQPQWKTVACQRFFPSREGSQYFEVTTPPPEKPSQHIIPVWAQAEKALEQRKQAIEWSEQKIVTEGEATEVNPWLERAGWHTYLAGIERDKLLESVDRPDAEMEPMLTAIWQAMDDMTSIASRPSSIEWAYSSDWRPSGARSTRPHITHCKGT